jgi:glycosyltransferase involved in cell wall biosynthesis
MLISLAIACMNRTSNLRRALPSIIRSANESPPVEITILDYGSTDDLSSYLEEASAIPLKDGNFFNFPKVGGKKYFCHAHAYNAAFLASHGEYIVQLCTEVMLDPGYVQYVRGRIETARPVWMCEGETGCLIVVQKQEFIEAGGYDERFVVYGPEDKDICARLHRRGGKFETYPPTLFTGVRTPDWEKMQNMNKETYRNKQEMARAMASIYYENIANGILVANENKEWGR